MIIKGTSCAGAGRLAVHLTRTDTNERVEVKEIRGVAAGDLLGALREMETVAAGTRTTKPFYHGSINTRADERLTGEQRMQAIDRLEAALGLTGQARVVVVHEMEGREHCHIVWSRIDLDRMAAISDSNNYRKHEEVARALEREFGHQRVQGAHIERDGKERPKRTPSHSEMLQAKRTGISTQQAKELMTGIWRTTKNGKQFQAALEQKGWMLARGDRRDFVAIDSNGGVHSMARRIEGAKAADVRQRFADVDPRDLKSVAEAKQIQRQRHGERDRQGMVANPRQPGQQLQTKMAMQTSASARPRRSSPGINPRDLKGVAKTKQVQRERQSGHERDRARSGVAKPRQPGQQLQPKTAEQAHTLAGPRQPAPGIGPMSPPSAAEAKQVQRRRRSERARQRMVANPPQPRQQLQPKTTEQPRALARPRQPALGIDPMSPPRAADAKQAQHGRQSGHERHHARPGAAKPSEPGQRLRPKAAEQARAPAGPRQRAPGFERMARSTAKIAASVFKAIRGETSASPKEPDPSPQGQDANAPSQRRQELMRQLSPEIPRRTERDAEIELDRGRERDRANLIEPESNQPGAGAAPAPKAGPFPAKPGYSNPAEGFRRTKRSVTRRRSPRRRIQVTTKGRGDVRVQGAPSLAAEAKKAFRPPSPDIRSGLNADQQEARDPGGPPSQPQAGSNGHENVRSAKAGDRNPDVIAGTSGDASAMPGVSAEFQSEMAALLAFYAARIAAARRGGLPAGDISAAVQAIVNEQTVALRALTDRWHAATQKQRDERPQRPKGNAQRKDDDRKPS